MTANLIFWMLMCHVIGDYILQSDWMAQNKRSNVVVAAWHVQAYSIPFLFITAQGFRGITQMWLITLSHLVIDHWGLARYVCFAKNFLAPRQHWPRWEDTDFTGYSADREKHVTFWLYVITDNLLHLLCNYIALRYL